MKKFSFKKIKNKNLMDLINLGKSAKELLGPPQGMTGRGLIGKDELLNIITGAASPEDIINITVTEKIYGRKKVLMELGSNMGALGLYNLLNEKEREKKHGPTCLACFILQIFLGFSNNSVKDEDIEKTIPFAKNMEKYNENNSCSPFLNSLEREIEEKKSGAEIIQKNIRLLINFTEATKKQFGFITKTIDSSCLLKEKGTISLNLKKYSEELFILNKIIGEKKDVKEYLKKLKVTSGDIFTSMEKLRKASEAIYSDFCLSCGFENDFSKNYCKKCNSPMPHFGKYINHQSKSVMGEEDNNENFDYIISYNLQKLSGGMENYCNTGMYRPGFSEELKEFHSLFNKTKKDINTYIDKISGWKDENEHFKKLIVESLKKGIKNISHGIKILETDISFGRKVNLKKGINLIIEGMNEIYMIQITGEEAERLCLKRS